MAAKEFNLKYGDSNIKFSFPEENLLGILESREMKKLLYPRASILDALLTPIASPPMIQIAKGKRGKVAIAVPDRTRAAKVDVVLPILIAELNNVGFNDEDITIFFACGTHRAHTDEERRKIIGPFVSQKKIRLVDHDCRDGSNLIEVGTTLRGNKIKLNRIVVQSDLRILLGGITYHYFAGYGGGRKTVMPGISAFETIQYNHKLLMGEKPGSGEDPYCITGNLKGNPVHEDMLEAARMLKPDFIINTVVNGARDLAGVFAGDLEQAHLAGCKFIDEHARVKIDEKADLVIASAGGGTKDMSFVQAHKGIENASYALKEGGTLIFAGEAAESLPSDEYIKYIELGSSERIEEELRRNFTISGHTIYSAVHKAEKFKIIWVTKMDRELVRKMKMTPVDTIEEALKLAGNTGMAYIMPEAYLTLPEVVK